MWGGWWGGGGGGGGGVGCFFFNDTATTEIYTLSLHDALPIFKFVSAVDCGQPINPPLAEGQVEGAVINGISYALCEEYIFNSKGKMVNPGFGDYKIFTAADIPEMETIIVASYEQSGPFGAKSISEIAINGPPPAIANAIFDAAGVRMYPNPFTPDRVWQELNK